MTTTPAQTLTPWVLSLGTILMLTTLGCGVTADDENNATTTPKADMSVTPTDMGGGATDQGGGATDQGGGATDQGGGVTDQGGGVTDQGGGVTDQGGGEKDMPADMTVVPPVGGWTVTGHPCVGNRTDALFCDDDQTCFTGCGTTTTGRGMFMTTDGGKTWGTVTTDPEDFLNGSRVNDIWRSPDDGKLYVAGEHGASLGVLSVDTDGTIGQVFKKGTKTDFSFLVGSFRRGANGRAIAESLTGSGIVYREADSTDPLDSWLSGREFPLDQFRGGAQILAMDVLGSDFYAAGSTIAQPPMAFLPAWDDTEFDFEILTLVDLDGLTAYTGEMWDIDVNDNGIVIGGVNQGAAVGMVYVFNFDGVLAPTDLANWKEYKVSKLFPGKATWVQGTCRDNGVIYAVGRESREGWGFVIRSKDNGDTWEDISPYDAGSSKSSLEDMYRCHVTSTGGVIVAGAGGEFAVYEE